MNKEIKGKNKKNINTKNYKKTPKKKKKIKTWVKILLIIVIILLISGGIFAYKVQLNGGGVSGMLATVVGHDENTKKNLPELKVLVLGISTDQDGVELTDTIMVASYNPKTQKASLLSIPRDTYTGKNASKATAYEKINALYGRKRRADETLEAVNKITGLGIEYYVVVRTEALIELVDAIGGVTFYVPMDMNYDDTTQDLHIHLKEGEQLLDGNKAEQLVRYRHDNPDKNGHMKTYPEEYGGNDLGRMRTQREFIMATIKQTAKPENIFKIGQILEVAEKNIETNIDFNVAKDYIPYIVEFNTENMETATLPGTTPDWSKTNNVSIFVVDEDETEKLIQKMFYDRDLEQEEVNKEGTNTTEIGKAISKKDIKIEVINGSGVSKNLQEVVKVLEGAGYEVTRTGVTNSTAKTAIINKKEVQDVLLNNIKDTIGIGIIQDSQSSSSKVDVTIVIGKDY